LRTLSPELSKLLEKKGMKMKVESYESLKERMAKMSHEDKQEAYSDFKNRFRLLATKQRKVVVNTLSNMPLPQNV